MKVFRPCTCLFYPQKAKHRGGIGTKPISGGRVLAVGNTKRQLGKLRTQPTPQPTAHVMDVDGGTTAAAPPPCTDSLAGTKRPREGGQQEEARGDDFLLRQGQHHQHQQGQQSHHEPAAACGDRPGNEPDRTADNPKRHQSPAIKREYIAALGATGAAAPAPATTHAWAPPLVAAAQIVPVGVASSSPPPGTSSAPPPAAGAAAADADAIDEEPASLSSKGAAAIRSVGNEPVVKHEGGCESPEGRGGAAAAVPEVAVKKCQVRHSPIRLEVDHIFWRCV